MSEIKRLLKENQDCREALKLVGKYSNYTPHLSLNLAYLVGVLSKKRRQPNIRKVEAVFSELSRAGLVEGESENTIAMTEKAVKYVRR